MSFPKENKVHSENEAYEVTVFGATGESAKNRPITQI